MTAIDKTPTNNNLLSPLGFKFSIKKLPMTNFFVQKAVIPGIFFSNTPEQPNPLVAIPHPGEQLTYDEFSITFLIDEDMKNYKEIYDWMRGLGFPEYSRQYYELQHSEPGLGGGIKSDATLTILSNGKSPNISIDIEDAFPVSLSNIELNVTDETVRYISATAKFRYTLYNFSYL